MDIKKIREALCGKVVEEASGTSATAGPGAIGGGVEPFKARMGAWRRQEEEVDPQAPGVVQSTQHASDAQLNNPMRETTHEEVNLFDEERIAFSELPLVPFGGFQSKDLEIEINNIFDRVAKIVEYNITNSTDPSNTNVQSLTSKYEELKKRAIYKIENVISDLEDGSVNTREKEINLSDIFQVICLLKAYGGDNDNDIEPKVYAKKLCERLLDIARNDALEWAIHLYKTLIPKIKPSPVTLMSMAEETIEAMRADKWAEAVVWNKLRKTVELMKIEKDDDDFDSELPHAEEEPEEAPLEEPQLVEEKVDQGVGATGANTTYPGSTVGNLPSREDGAISKCPSFPLQGSNPIHEEEAAPSEITPLQLGDISIQGYFASEQGKPTLLRYKVLKNNVPLPVDKEKVNSKNIGHTKEQVLKKLSMLPEKIKFVKQFIKHNKENENTLKSKQQEKVI